MDVGPLLIADAQAAKLVQPRKCPLHDPAPPPQATSVLGASHGRRVGRPARRRSDDACFRAWPDQWDLDRSGHLRTPRGWNNCPRPPATNQSGRRARANPAAQSGSSPRPPFGRWGGPSCSYGWASHTNSEFAEAAKRRGAMSSRPRFTDARVLVVWCRSFGASIATRF